MTTVGELNRRHAKGHSRLRFFPEGGERTLPSVPAVDHSRPHDDTFFPRVANPLPASQNGCPLLDIFYHLQGSRDFLTSRDFSRRGESGTSTAFLESDSSYKWRGGKTGRCILSRTGSILGRSSQL
jgi:hypothetical protein